MPNLPDLTPEQRKANLEKAKEVRKARAVAKEAIKAGEITAADVFDRADDPVYGRMFVRHLIESLPGYGKARAAAIMAEIGISENRRVSGLGARQKEKLLAALA